ncbi:MAG TPA: serine/threonine-protein kinase [Kofleriaceae bacterium]
MIEPARDDTLSATNAPPTGFVVGAQVAGRYLLVRPLGCGGMGEVFEADDLVVGTRIALKVLRADHTDSASIERLRREIALARKITHRNVCRIHDLGEHEHRVFLTMELLAGETLAARIARGPLDLTEARTIVEQLALGLDAAHAAGVVHRDFKSSNIILAGDRAVVTDFGLARSEVVGEYSRLTADTALLGSPAYMSPEQVEGRPATAASDIYAFGVVAFEMTTGQLPFHAESPFATASLRVTARAPRARRLRRDLPAAWDSMIARCLERNPRHRFACAADAVAHLAKPRLRWSRSLMSLPVLALAAAALVGGNGLIPRAPPKPHVASEFLPVTFRRGTVFNARFASDGRIVYAAAWDGEPVSTYLATPGTSDVRVLFGPAVSLLSLSPRGDVAVLTRLRARDIRFPLRGTLAIASLAGGEPRPLADNVYAADWRAGDDKPALVRLVGQHDLVEFPYGHQILDHDQGVPGFRVSRDGQRAAVAPNDEGRARLLVFEAAGNARTLLDGWRDIRGLAWSMDQREIWFSGRRIETTPNTANAIYAVDLDGHVREILRTPGSLLLHDIAADGRVLFSQEEVTREAGLYTVESNRPLSWLDDTMPVALSDDGTRMLFDDGGAAPLGQTYERRLDGSPPVKLIDSIGLTLSPDGAYAIAYDPAHVDPPPERLLLIPTGVGDPHSLRAGPIEVYRGAAFSSDGHRLVTVGVPHGERAAPRLYMQDLPNGEPRAISPIDTTFQVGAQPLSPDGRLVFARAGDGKWHVYSTSGDRAKHRELRGLDEDDMLLRWATNRGIYVSRKQQSSVDISLLDIDTGQRDALFSVGPADRVGVEMPPRVIITADAKTCVYSYARRLSRLFVVRGLH